MLTAAMRSRHATPPQSICECRANVAHEIGGERPDFRPVAGVDERRLQRARAARCSSRSAHRSAVSPAPASRPVRGGRSARGSGCSGGHLPRSSGVNASGTQSRTSGLRNVNDSGITPTTVIALVVHARARVRRCRPRRRAARLANAQLRTVTRLLAGRALVLGKHTSARRRHLQHVEERRRDAHRRDALGACALADAESAGSDTAPGCRRRP